MKVVGLISGGKDSIFNLYQCLLHGHEIVALANIYPEAEAEKDERDSFMYQTVGYTVIPLIAQCLELPLYRKALKGTSLNQNLQYAPSQSSDEVEDLLALLQEVKSKHPDVQAVSSGAILSTYQRTRVENVCSRLELISLAYLWQRDQKTLLEDMISSGLDAILIKVAAMGLNKRHIGQTLKDLHSELCTLNSKYGLNVCGEGGEYESLVLDCPLYKKRIVIEESKVVVHSDDAFAPVAYLTVKKCRLEDKKDAALTILPHLNAPTSLPKNSKEENKHPKSLLSLLSNDNSSNFSQRNGFFYAGFQIATHPNQHSYAEELTIVMNNLKALLSKEGVSMNEVFFVYLYINDMQYFTQLNSVYKNYFNINPPSRACVELSMQNKLMIECIGYSAALNKELDPLHRNTLHVQSISDWAPACIGPYSQSNTVGNVIYLAGQIGLDAGYMQLVKEPLTRQSNVTIQNVCSVLDVVDSNLSHALAITVYLTHINDYDVVQKSLSQRELDKNVMIHYVELSALPKEADVELQVIAVTKSSLAIENINTRTFGITTAPLSISLTSLTCVDTLRIVHCYVHHHATCKQRPQSVTEDELSDSLKRIAALEELNWNEVLYCRLYYDIHSVTDSILSSSLNALASVNVPLTCIPSTALRTEHIQSILITLEVVSHLQTTAT